MLPGVLTASNYRTERVDLQPGGNTVTVDAPSDNPFEDLAGPVTVVTQASGGMSSPDPRMRSKRIVGRKIARHISAGFLPGMGDGEEIEVGLFGTVRKTGQLRGKPRKQRVHVATSRPVTAGFLPGMGSDMDDQVDGLGLTPAEEAQLREMNQFQAQVEMKNAELKAKKESEDAKRSSEAWSAFGKGLLEAGKGTADVLKAKTEAKTMATLAQSKAQIEAERARAAEAGSRAAQADASARSDIARFAAENKGKIGIGIAVAVALAVGAYFLLRKKG